MRIDKGWVLAVAGLGLTLGCAALVAQTAVPAVFGAIAVDQQQDGYWGTSTGAKTRAEAAQKALDKCRNYRSPAANCKLVVEFAGRACAAYSALSPKDGTAIGWAVANHPLDADRVARDECRKRSTGKVCMAGTYVCNYSGGPATARSGGSGSAAVQQAGGKGGCLVQYYLNVDPVGPAVAYAEVYSPVYVLKAADCPQSSPTEFGAYVRREFAGEVSSTIPSGTTPGVVKGRSMVEAYARWAFSRSYPVAGWKIRRAAGMRAVADTPYLRELLTAEAGRNYATVRRIVSGTAPPKLERGVPISPAKAGYCPDYKPEGITPIATLGAENCRSWVR